MVGSVYHLKLEKTRGMGFRSLYEGGKEFSFAGEILKPREKTGTKRLQARQIDKCGLKDIVTLCEAASFFLRRDSFFAPVGATGGRQAEALKIKGFGSLKKERSVTKLKFIEIFSFLGLAF